MIKFKKFILHSSHSQIAFKGLLLCALFHLSFMVIENSTFQDKAINYFQKLGETVPEKIYLHLDKPYYSAGDKIWFRGYLVNAISHKENSLSNYIYVELINRNDSVLIRHKFARDSSGFSGQILLPSEITPDQYCLRAYTNWMRNSDSSYFYQRNITIDNAIATQINASIKYNYDRFGDDVIAEMRFYDNDDDPYTNIKMIAFLMEKGNSQKRDILFTDSAGVARFKFSKKQISAHKKPRITVDFNDETYQYHREFFLPTFNDDYHVTFMPEGGNLLSGVMQNIAFKVQHESGHSDSIYGIIVDQTGDTLTSINTLHEGMGLFPLQAKAGESYTAYLTSESGVKKEFKLPVVQPQGFALSITSNRNQFVYQVNTTEQTLWPDSLFVIGHSRGEIKYLYLVTQESPAGIIPTQAFSEGIVHFLLVDKAGEPLSERLAFVLPSQSAAWEITTDQKKYPKREAVNVEIALADSLNPIPSGCYSVSITDNKQIAIPQSITNIYADLLLTSDIKGYIENPGYYFENIDRKKLYYLDLVMLTHGWTRYDFKQMSNSPQISIFHFLEQGETVTGQVLNAFNKPKKGAGIALISPLDSISIFGDSDENGRFSFDVSASHDSTLFWAIMMTRNSADQSEIRIDPESYPAVFNKNRYQPFTPRLSDDYLKRSKEAYFSDGGVPVFFLKEVVVTAQRKTRRPTMYSAGASDMVKRGDDFTKSPSVKTLLDALKIMPGVFVSGIDKVLVRQKEPMIMINDVEISDNSILTQVMANEIDEIIVMSDATAGFIKSYAMNGIIAITLTTDFVAPDKSKPSAKSFTRLNARKASEFYHPVYETPEDKKSEKRDYRSTLYWNPYLKIDEAGKAAFRFYTSDASVNYHIIIEGVTTDGKTYRYDKDMDISSTL